MPRLLHNWKVIQEYHDLGHGFVECQKQFGFSHTAWVKAIKSGKLQSTERDFPDRRRRYDWAAVQAYYDDGHSYRECRARFGFNPLSWHKARLRGEIRTRPPGIPLDRLLVENGGSRRTVKYRLLSSGAIINRCDNCGLREWRGKPISMQLDHINGVRNDHRLENLRMLCPNCHSQTETFGAKNKGRLRSLQDPTQAV